MRQATVATCARRSACAPPRDPLGTASRISQWYRRANTPNGEFVRPRRRGFQTLRLSSTRAWPLGVRETDLCSIAYLEATAGEVVRGRDSSQPLLVDVAEMAASNAALGRSSTGMTGLHREGTARVLAVLAGEPMPASSLTDGAKDLFSALDDHDVTPQPSSVMLGPRVCLDRPMSEQETATWFAPPLCEDGPPDDLIEQVHEDWLTAEAFGRVAASLAMDTVAVDAMSRAWIVDELDPTAACSESASWPGAILLEDEQTGESCTPATIEADDAAERHASMATPFSDELTAVELSRPIEKHVDRSARKRNAEAGRKSGRAGRSKRRLLSLRWLRRRGKRPEEVRKQRQALIRRAISEKQHLTAASQPGREPGRVGKAGEPVRLTWRPGDPFAGYSGTKPRQFRWHTMFLTAGGVAGFGAGIGYVALWMTGLTGG